MKHLLFCLTWICSVSLSAMATPNPTQLLKELDRVVLAKGHYHAQRETRLSALKEAFFRAVTPADKYRLCGSLFHEYLHYQADSALHYINQRQHFIEPAAGGFAAYELYINRAEVYGVMGMYNEAKAELKKVDVSVIQADKELYSYYLKTFRACYGWLADYIADQQVSSFYAAQTELYRDSIDLLSLPETNHVINKAEKMIYRGDYQHAIALLEPLVDDTISLKQKAYANYTLAQAYEALQDTVNQITYLARTSLLDIQMAEREYASLQKLAWLLYCTGQLDRAYSYLTCSMEDAVAANARLRFLEVTQIYPIIERAYSNMEAEERIAFRNMLISVSLLALLLIIATFYLYYWMKKLSVMRRDLYRVNKQLVEANKNLQQMGKIKEVYIAKYLDKCVNYLEKLEQYRRSLEKLAMASKTSELFKAIKSEEFLRNERKMFYNEFDKSFLDLFPNFVNDFNRLLQDDAHIFPKKDEQLSTELRIFALIRLGVTDANHIAHFLGYSLATVYNYRSKIRNKAKNDKDTFEQEVMNL